MAHKTKHMTTLSSSDAEDTHTHTFTTIITQHQSCGNTFSSDAEVTHTFITIIIQHHSTHAKHVATLYSQMERRHTNFAHAKSMLIFEDIGC